jgi:hypothetical protein
MKIKKTSGQYNTYSAELTYGELLHLRDALAQSPGMGPEADEMLEGFNWYLEKMPEPGEEGDKKEGTSDNPNMAKDKADDALSPMLLEPAPGQEDTVAGEDDRDEETLADRLGVNTEEEELPEPPTR